MLGRKFNKRNWIFMAVIPLMFAGTSFVTANEETEQLHSRRLPHPPTTRPPAISERMRQVVSLPQNEPIQRRQPVQTENRVQRMQPIQSSTPAIQTVQKPQPAPQPEPIKVASNTEPVHEIEVAPALHKEKTTPADFSGYIVFIAGALLLFRKSS
jgi:hypothetical protein